MRAGEVAGGFQLSVLSLGAKRSRSTSATHRIKVVLTPVDREGRERLINAVGDRGR